MNHSNNHALASAVALIATVLLGTQVAEAVTYNFAGESRNIVEWLSTAPMKKIKGTASSVTGKVSFDPAKLKELKGEIIVPVATMKSGSPIRDRHLKGKKWLNAAAHPNLSFKVGSVSKVTGGGGSASLSVAGTFSCHGVSKPMNIPVTIKWNAKVMKLETRFSIVLADFKVTGAEGVVGKKVGKTIAITATLYGKPAAR